MTHSAVTLQRFDSIFFSILAVTHNIVQYYVDIITDSESTLNFLQENIFGFEFESNLKFWEAKE